MAEPTTKDRLDLAIVKHGMDLTSAQKELTNENLTEGQTRAVHVEIEQLKFSLKTLKFIKG
jgi:hypothetical protein